MKAIKKIVVVGPQSPDTLPKSILLTLQKMGYDAEPVDEREMLGFSYRKDIEKSGRVSFITKVRSRMHDIRLKSSARYEQKIFTRVAKEIIKKKPDLVIMHSAWTPPEAIEYIKNNTEAKVVCWFPDHPGNIGRQYIYAAPYDALFFKDRFLVSRAKSIGKNAYYLPEACMPEWHKSVELSEEDKRMYGCDVTTAGNLYYFRAIVFENLMKRFSVKLWGDVPRWLKSPARALYQGRNVSEIEKSKAFRTAKIVLNTFQGEVEGVNQRFFEIAGCGGFQICEHRDEIKEFLTPDKEIVTFTNLKDLMEKIEYYLAHPEEMERIASAGQKRAHEEHTFQKRLEAMMKIIETL